ncbi:hypothetical protein BDA99DRAFT_495937 [Phascolomyces articulosus]|uniref:Defect at low temperature protein 1 n=1 Tax=Phascolomyces articulosus TaxID=60185 RepID=A0AAD5PKF7_9FUNG|nr:hypothetical protein BDA99DRAFT_495937 [Phascolomyces articulosus]
MKSTRRGHCLYTSSLFFLIFLTAVCIAISAADVIVQALFDRTESGRFDLRNLFVVAASYVVLAIASLAFSCSRFFTVRASLQDIPKIYIPIKKDDLPKKVYSHIQGQFDDVKHVRKLAEPRPEDIGHVGWGKPGDTQFEGVDFKRVIARTPMFIEQAALKISSDYARPSHVPTRQYIEYLIQRGLVDAQIGQVYVNGYEQARFSHVPVNQDTFKDIMTHLAVVLRQMGYAPQNPTTLRPEESSSISTRSGSTSHLLHPDPSLRRISSAGASGGPDDLLLSSSIRGSGTPRDDDVASLAQSIATWTSRSTSNTRSRYARSNSQRSTPQNNGGDDSTANHHDDIDDSDAYDDDDENHYDYDRHIRQVIYSRLMMDR